MKHNLLIFLSIFFFSILIVFSGCSSPAVVSSHNQTNASQAQSEPVISNPTTLTLTASGLEYLVKLNQETTISLDAKTTIVKITGANSKDDSVVLSVKQGTGENVKKVLVNQVISFGALRICIADTAVDQKTGNAQALIVPTYSQKAVAWYSMVATTNATDACDSFTSAVELSSKKDGAVTFFSKAYNSVSDSTAFVSLAYQQMLGKNLDSLSAQAWEFYVKENGREKFLGLLVASDDFKTHESSIK